MKKQTSANLASLPPLFGERRLLAIAGGIFLLTTLMVFGDLLFSDNGHVLSMEGTDLSEVFVGWTQFTVVELAGNHHLPLWNPHLFSGTPCLGGFQEAMLYPPTWLLFVMPLPLALNWGIAVHVFLAGLFMYMWMARKGVHPLGGILAGLVFMFGGGYFMHITAGYLSSLRAMVWAPLIFLAIDDLTTTRSLRSAWLGSAAVAMQILAGHPQYTYYTALLAGPYALVGVWRAPSRSRAMVGLALMAVGAIGLSAMQLFTGIDAAQESIRSKLGIDVASTFPFPPENVLTLVLPQFFGHPSEHMYWGRSLLWEDSLFVGVTALSLAIFALFRGDKAMRPRFLAGFLVVSLAIAFGINTPLYRPLYHFLPGFGSFRGVSKMAFIAAMMLAALVGIGCDAMIRAGSLSRKAPAIILSSATILLALAVAIWFSGNAGGDGHWAHALFHISWFARSYPRSSLASSDFFQRSAHIAAKSMFWCAGSAVLLGALWFFAKNHRKVVYAIAGLALAELLIFAWQNRPTFEIAHVLDAEMHMRSRLDELDEVAKQCYPNDLDPIPRVMTTRESVVLGAGGDEGWGNGPMALRRYTEFMSIDQDGPADNLLQHGFARSSPIWGMFRIFLPRYFNARFTWKPAGPLLARAQLVESARVIDDPKTLLATIAGREFDPRREVLVEKPIAILSSHASTTANTPAGTVSLKDLSTDEIEVTADVARPCVLLMSDTYSKGWRVEPIGKSPPQPAYEVIPADHAMRAIPLASGKHHFTLEYRPMMYVTGKWVTIFSFVAWIGTGVVLRRRAMPPTPAK
jgi:hypothetical protein